MTPHMVFRFSVCSLLGGIFVLLLANTLYVPHPPHTNVAVTCPGASAQAAGCRTHAAAAQPTVARAPGTPHTIVVDILRSELDRGTPQLASHARFVPTLTNGKPSGFKVYAIRPGSLAATLGLANGDKLLTINDVKLSSPVGWTSPEYQRLTKPSFLDIELRRRGEPLRILVVVHNDAT